ncbi:transmembrane protein 187 [Electrophorus electricus]|uniref:Transmembrane protein 187 n=1 Tax=Electrophorus electricus TaxID=8005 RepID=A0A4W4E7C2_ELEEL|nr:transmembrane protein 187 [Electrophorus electricus]
MMSAAVHVILPFLLCVTFANTGLFDKVAVDMSYDAYAEKKVDQLHALLAMPFNCLINVGYVIVGICWLRRHMADGGDARCAGYMKDVFAFMAIAYGPVQWIRLATLRRAPSVLDQWVTLPIFAWVPVWCHVITNGWSTNYALIVEACSVISYALALFYEQGFEVALSFHITFALLKCTEVQRRHGDAVSLRYFAQAALSCCGFVILKLLDHTLAQFWVFQNLTGHFWSKVCDILQFHYSFCFLTRLTQIAHKAT